MTEHELKQIHINNRLMATLQTEYEETCGYIGISPLVQDGMPHGSNYKATGIPTVEKRVDIELECRRLYEDNRRLIERARKYIEQFPDEILRIVLTLKYINGMGEIEIAEEAGISVKDCYRITKVHFNNVF